MREKEAKDEVMRLRAKLDSENRRYGAIVVFATVSCCADQADNDSRAEEKLRRVQDAHQIELSDAVTTLNTEDIIVNKGGVVASSSRPRSLLISLVI